MKNQFKTHEADITLTQKFLDYASADGSYVYLKYALYSILGILVITSFNGCSFSFKSIDPQYYKFKEMCKNESSKTTIYNKYYWEIFANREKGNTQHDDGGEYYYNKDLGKKIYFDYQKAKSINVNQREMGRITDTTFDEYYDDIHYATIHSYSYTRNGIFLGGDEGNGFYWYYEKTDYCK